MGLISPSLSAALLTPPCLQARARVGDVLPFLQALSGLAVLLRPPLRPSPVLPGPLQQAPTGVTCSPTFLPYCSRFSKEGH